MSMIFPVTIVVVAEEGIFVTHTYAHVSSVVL
jgi:hypothetical protein